MLHTAIPPEKEPAIRKALQTALNAEKFEDIQPLTKGLSGALVFKITVYGVPYVLRLIIRNETRDNPTYYFDCLQAAANAGLAPAIHYLDPEDRISITDFIREKCFPVSVARHKMADMLRDLHALPKFPYQLKYMDAADAFLQKFLASKIVPQSITKDLFELYARIGKVYPVNDIENLVSSHNDVKPDNIIFDGIRPWLVDWEAARLNDRYVDLVSIANFVVKDDEEEADFLKRYFGEALDEYKQARFFLMSLIVHMFCFTLCTPSGSGGRSIDTNLNTPGFRKYHERLWNGEINLGSNDEKLQYAWVHMEEMLNKMHTNRFEESLRIVSDNSNTMVTQKTIR